MYDSKGKLIAVNTDKKTITPYGCETFEIDGQTIPVNCARVKWFMWNLDNVKPLG